MKYLEVVFLSGLLFGLSGVANAASPTNDDLYKMLLKQQEKIASLEANQRSLEQDVTNSKLREARLRDDLHKAKTQLASVQKAANNDFGEPAHDTPQREQGFVASAGVLYVRPHSPNLRSNDHSFDLGFDVTAGYQDDNNVDYAINYKHFEVNSNSENSRYGDILTDANWDGSGVGANLVGLPTGNSVPVSTDSYDVKYDVVDFEIGKRLQLADSISLRLSGGLRYAAIGERVIQRNPPSLNRAPLGTAANDSVNAVLGTGELNAVVCSSGTTGLTSGAGVGPYGSCTTSGTSSTSSADLWGVGFKAGIAPEWHPINSNFRIFSSLSGAYLVGKLDGTGTDGGLTDNTSLFSMVQTSVGIGYMLPTSLGDFDVNVRYQYELLDINSTINPPSDGVSVNYFNYRGYDGVYGSISYAFNSGANH